MEGNTLTELSNRSPFERVLVAVAAAAAAAAVVVVEVAHVGEGVQHLVG